MGNFLKHLTEDFTLFNLNDPKTTKSYLDNLDYLIENFPYFRDIKALTDFFLSKNKKFDLKFQTKIGRFLGIIDYDDSLCW